MLMTGRIEAEEQFARTRGRKGNRSDHTLRGAVALRKAVGGCQDTTPALTCGAALCRDEKHSEFEVEERPDIVVPNNGPTSVIGTLRKVKCDTELPQEALMFETFRRVCNDPG